ncbi:hypothetical protein Ddc_02806 [Ditylenchus destructor]|nr:hypothetical protein Ddc_02806 [Ditylenchus destructor]
MSNDGQPTSDPKICSSLQDVLASANKLIDSGQYLQNIAPVEARQLMERGQALREVARPTSPAQPITIATPDMLTRQVTGALNLGCQFAYKICI